MTPPYVVNALVRCSVCGRFQQHSTWVKLTDEQLEEVHRRVKKVHHKICPQCHEEAMSIVNKLQGICDKGNGMRTRIRELQEDGEVINEVSLKNALALYSLFDSDAIESSKISLDPENCIYMTVDREHKKYIIRFRANSSINLIIMNDNRGKQ